MAQGLIFSAQKYENMRQWRILAWTLYSIYINNIIFTGS